MPCLNQAQQLAILFQGLLGVGQCVLQSDGVRGRDLRRHVAVVQQAGHLSCSIAEGRFIPLGHGNSPPRPSRWFVLESRIPPCQVRAALCGGSLSFKMPLPIRPRALRMLLRSGLKQRAFPICLPPLAGWGYLALIACVLSNRLICFRQVAEVNSERIRRRQ